MVCVISDQVSSLPGDVSVTEVNSLMAVSDTGALNG